MACADSFPIMESGNECEWRALYEGLNYKLDVKFHATSGTAVMYKSICSRVTWDGIKELAMFATCSNATEWFFRYEDVESRRICGSSNAEWRAMVEISKNMNQFSVDVFALDSDISGMSLKY